jgi:hypothetical protein
MAAAVVCFVSLERLVHFPPAINLLGLSCFSAVAADKAHFEDVLRHKYFNTNNLWVNLPMLKVGKSTLCVLLLVVALMGCYSRARCLLVMRCVHGTSIQLSALNQPLSSRIVTASADAVCLHCCICRRRLTPATVRWRCR